MAIEKNSNSAELSTVSGRRAHPSLSCFFGVFGSSTARLFPGNPSQAS